MGYMHINNLYKETDILLFKEVYCLEKIHGTSAHISYQNGALTFFSGGVDHQQFVALFDQAQLLINLQPYRHYDHVTIYGEAYGGKCQNMSDTYGKDLRFIAFDVKIGDSWLSVPQAEAIVLELGLEFVFYVNTKTDSESLNFERDRDSEQGKRNGMGNHPSEGVVIRPLIELTKNNGERVIAKYKKDKFRETKTARPVNAERLEILKNAEAIAEEWVVPERVQHVVNSLNIAIETSNIPAIIRGMLEDVKREAAGEIIWNKEVERSIGKTTAYTVKQMCSQFDKV
jgi:hypothetical protein